MNVEDCFEIGYITKTRGLKGEVQVSFTFDEPEKLKINSVLVEINNKLVPFFVSNYKIPMPLIGYFNFEDIDHIDKAQAITKKKIYLLNKFKPKKKKGEFLFTDLIGFTASDQQSGDLGEILEVREYPQQFLATINYKGNEVLIPLNEAFILEIDIPNKKINFDLPDGLLDLYSE
ncbi:MAG: ribosome maturation factor RimM [Bacteroidetes bacterium]|nr:ribosome maturation factor RimM [Bacteroidota bacterium]MBU1483717.1 ribosome maturation factor RimM [Bacteroidota bacterium]MBU1761201.1 ribosome maturation factor RimM [Bacteroidota bacterium]MBU2046185.1 ribosome maturation factor RimM [Bacteroidota bacterium]MBU2268060.1 ribosome maturation factor RimM [Bacteroidota bacterium]